MTAQSTFLNGLYLDDVQHDARAFNFELAYGSKIHPWSKWEKYTDVEGDDAFIERANNRRTFPNEVVLDYESEDEYKANVEKVKADFKFYQIYDSGSRGNHIHLWYDRNLKPHEKLNIIKKYDADVNLAKEKCVIALEYSPHWKDTGRSKTLIEEVKGRNHIEEEKQVLEVEGIQRTIQQTMDMPDLALRILEVQPLYYDDNKMWWGWQKQKCFWRMIDETFILNVVATASYNNTTNSKQKAEILEALRQKARLNKPQELKPTWIQFRNEIYDTTTGEQFPATSKYFAVNPLPYGLNVEKQMDTPTIDRIFSEWVGEEYVQQLHEVVAFCLIPSYPLHRMFFLLGAGSNGKTCFLNLVKKLVGEPNVCSTELEQLAKSRFERAKLYKKLVCLMGETNYHELKNTPLLKRLTGEDTIGFEIKHKTPFDAYNYAKMLIATNSLPTTPDKTDGFYRRQLIIDFPHQFSEKVEILATIPDEEMEKWTWKLAFQILPDLLQKKEFTKEGTIEEKRERYEIKSNPLGKFIEEHCTTDNANGFVFKGHMLDILNAWCEDNHFRRFSTQSMAKGVRNLGYTEGREQPYPMSDGAMKTWRCFYGLEWKEGVRPKIQEA